MNAPLLETRGLSKAFGGITATEGVDLDVGEGKIHAVIGPNGAGKTTLIAQLAGMLAPDSGRIIFAGRDITRLPTHARARLGIARSFQITSIFHAMSVLDNTLLAVQAHDGHSYRFWRRARRDKRLTGPAMAALEQVGLGHKAASNASGLSHGEHRQLEIAMALAGASKLLLLDEPMAGMGAEESARMVVLLRGLKETKSILLIEHDMDVVFALADRITVMVDGKAIASGKPEQIRADENVRRAYLGMEGPGETIGDA
ncbi:MAG: ABC transporter ATP-binding protein [Alphaproteobacteria bacterium]|jgi:branched-chain amino acid transport system ATP-binding protein|nr:ABC transporter ATP-binding protein [Alphaproteobacteria bacterium]MDP6819706.1 ABC transporter ATP-binding protein [Alphaproteobacteria bacterium]|tara:strand:+ start:1191 stop:1964 length:774 start_codon:yes stop_codon:yes gene_type:complete